VIGEVEILNMSREDLEEVCFIERRTFPSPWSRGVFENELAKAGGTRTGATIYLVAKIPGRVVGYTGLFQVGDEGHITNLAVDFKYRRKGIGTLLVLSLIESATRRGIKRLTLEVRKPNLVAQEFYRKFGFREVGLRKGYYSDTGEDAVVMWIGDITSEDCLKRLEGLREELREKRRKS